MTEYKYVRGTPDNWDADLDKLRLVDSQIIGPCPRCHHNFSQDISPQSGMGLAATPTEILVELVCSCAGSHEGAPLV
jgi:hypothetical protein